MAAECVNHSATKAGHATGCKNTKIAYRTLFWNLKKFLNREDTHLKLYAGYKIANINGKNWPFTTKCYGSKTAGRVKS